MEYKLEKALEGMRNEYDYIFIDCAPTDSVLTTMALTASDFILIPVRPDRFSILGYGNLLKTVRTFRGNCQDPHNVKQLGIVFTQVTGNSDIESDCMQQIKVEAAKQGDHVFANILKWSNSYIRAVKDQTPIFDTLHARWAGSRSNVSAIAREMLAQIEKMSQNDQGS